MRFPSKPPRIRPGTLLVCEVEHAGKVVDSLNDFRDVPAGTVVEYLYTEKKHYVVHILGPLELLATAHVPRRACSFGPYDECLRVHHVGWKFYTSGTS